MSRLNKALPRFHHFLHCLSDGLSLCWPSIGHPVANGSRSHPDRVDHPGPLATTRLACWTRHASEFPSARPRPARRVEGPFHGGLMCQWRVILYLPNSARQEKRRPGGERSALPAACAMRPAFALLIWRYFPIFWRPWRQRFTSPSGSGPPRSCSTIYHWVPPASQRSKTSFHFVRPSPITALASPPYSFR